MKPTKTWEEVAAKTAVDYFLRLLDDDIKRLQDEITEIYPELGRQAYRYRESLTQNLPWVVEEKLLAISRKDEEITRISQLRESIIDALKKQAEKTT